MTDNETVLMPQAVKMAMEQIIGGERDGERVLVIQLVDDNVKVVFPMKSAIAVAEYMIKTVQAEAESRIDGEEN